MDKMCCSDTQVCDGDPDCANGADERDCSNSSMAIVCTKDQFKCANNHCIDSNWVCDGELDCRKGEDENNCEYHTTVTP